MLSCSLPKLEPANPLASRPDKCLIVSPNNSRKKRANRLSNLGVIETARQTQESYLEGTSNQSKLPTRPGEAVMLSGPLLFRDQLWRVPCLGPCGAAGAALSK